MVSRRQFDESLDQFLVSGDQSCITPYLHAGESLVPLLVELLVDRISFFYNSCGGNLGDIHYLACVNITHGISRIIKLIGEQGVRTLKQMIAREGRLYRNVAAFLVSAEEQPDELSVAIIHSLGDLPDTWLNEPAKALLALPIELFFEQNPYASTQEKFGIDLTQVLMYIFGEAVDYICQHLNEHRSGNLSEPFLSDQAINKCRILSNIPGWSISPTNIVSNNEVRLFDAPIKNGLMAPNIRIKRIRYKRYNVKDGGLLATASHLIVFDSRSKTTFGFPYREISTVSSAGEETYVSFRDNSNLIIETSFPKPGIIGTLAILGAPPEEKLFHYSIEQDRANTADNFLGLWGNFFNEILDENRHRQKFFDE